MLCGYVICSTMQELGIDRDVKPCTLERNGKIVLFDGSNYICTKG